MWSAKHKLDSCRSCGTTEQPHRGHGMCAPCYMKANGYTWQKAYQSKNRPQINAYALEWAKANPAAVHKSRRKWQKDNPDKTRKYLQTWRANHRAPFCLICGEDRAVEWAHIVAHHKGGPVAHWNLIPLCPTHHRCFDNNKLTSEETALIQPYVDAATSEYSKLSLPGALG
jgi:hypothetical protein